MKKIVGVINAEFTERGMVSLEINGPVPIIQAGLLSIIDQICKIEGITEQEYIEKMLRVVKQREEFIAKHKDLLDKMWKMKEYCDKTDCANCTVDHVQREKDLDEIMEMLFGEKEEAN